MPHAHNAQVHVHRVARLCINVEVHLVLRLALGCEDGGERPTLIRQAQLTGPGSLDASVAASVTTSTTAPVTASVAESITATASGTASVTALSTASVTTSATASVMASDPARAARIYRPDVQQSRAPTARDVGQDIHNVHDMQGDLEL